MIASVNMDPSFRHLAEDCGLPVVTIGPNPLGVPAVMDDHAAIGRLAADYFLERRFTNVAFYHEYTHLRGYCFSQQMDENHLEVYSLIPPHYESNWKERMAWVQAELQRFPKPLAVFCADDNGASEILTLCQLSGLDVPLDVAILGVHNDPLICESVPVKLSSIDSNLQRQGYLAAQLLADLMAGKAVNSEPVAVAPAGVVSRRSTEIEAYESAELIRVMDFIRHHFCEYLAIEDLVNLSGISRKQLFRLFQREIGKTPNAVITALRMEKAEQLLGDPELSIQEIAEQCGYSSYRVFHHRFSQFYGCSPGALRAQ